MMSNQGPARECETKFDLIITIVSKGRCHLVVEASKRAGAEGGTILGARGTGIHETAKLLGVPIEPEKDIILTLVPRCDTDKVLDAILEDGEMNKPGKGITFVLEVKRVAGITHLLEEEMRQKLEKKTTK